MSRTVIAAVDDIVFVSKIRATAEHLGVEVRFARNVDAVLAVAREGKANLIVVDLQSQRVNAIELAKELKRDERLRGIPLIGFFSHVLADLQRSAGEAGFDRVVPRSVFSRDLARILADENEA